MKDARTYVQTLRNMWLAAGFFNPLIAVLAMAVMPMDVMYANSNNLLAAMAKTVGGEPLQAFLCVDGAIVLAGSVLTAYVGVMGEAGGRPSLQAWAKETTRWGRTRAAASKSFPFLFFWPS